MKNYFLILLLSIASYNIAIAQTILSEQRGVALSYSSSYVNTIDCAGEKFDQYKIVAQLKNYSGHAISTQESYVQHTLPNGASCWPLHPFAGFYSKDRWPNSSVETTSYFTVVKSGDALPDPRCMLGSFRFLDGIR